MLHHRVGGGVGIERHRVAALVGRAGLVDIPLRMQLGGGARLHPVGEAFVEPQVVPPRHGHQITEPLMGDFVRGDGEHVLFVADGGDRRIQQ